MQDASKLLAQSVLTANQFKVLHAVRYLENPTLQAIKYLTNIQLVRVEEAVAMLHRKQLVEVTSRGVRLRDECEWCRNCLSSRVPCKMHRLLRSSKKYLQLLRSNSLNNLHEAISPAFSIVAYVELKLQRTFPSSKWQAEASNAAKLYKLALSLTGDERRIEQLIVDYLDLLLEDSFFTSKVKYPVGYMYGGFAQYYVSIPMKPREILEQEELTGYRFTFNNKRKKWEMKNARAVRPE